MPSSTTSTLELPEMVLVPRTVIDGSEPAELACPTFKPGTVPCRDWRRLVLGDFSNALMFALATAPVRSLFFMVP